MGNSKPDKKGNTNCQTFESYKNLNYVQVSDKLLEDLNKQKDQQVHSHVPIVQKYLPIDRFIDSIIHMYFYMSAPSTWDDTFEVKYKEALDKYMKNYQSEEETALLKDMSVFGTCMTYNDSENEEASWKAYEDHDNMIRVTYDFEKLCTILNKVTDKAIYVGKVVYKPRKDIVVPTSVPANNKCGGTINKEEKMEALYVNNFCYKQIAYEYEKELRFCRIEKGDSAKNKKGHKIEHVDLRPAITKITLPPINFKRIDTEKPDEILFKQIKKCLLLKAICPNIAIHKSNLYDSSEKEMTSEFIFTNNSNES